MSKEKARNSELEKDESLKDEETCEEIQEDKSENQTEKSQQDAEESNDERYIRLMADFQNYKRRTEKEKSDIYAYANEKIVSELLDVIDNFERALDHGENDENFVTGMTNIFKMFRAVLEKCGLEEIESLGIEFDPNFHNAVMTEDNDEVESGHISSVLQKGYKLNGKVIRPSMVKVAN